MWSNCDFSLSFCGSFHSSLLRHPPAVSTAAGSPRLLSLPSASPDAASASPRSAPTSDDNTPLSDSPMLSAAGCTQRPSRPATRPSFLSLSRSMRDSFDQPSHQSAFAWFDSPEYRSSYPYLQANAGSAAAARSLYPNRAPNQRYAAPHPPTLYHRPRSNPILHAQRNVQHRILHRDYRLWVRCLLHRLQWLHARCDVKTHFIFVIAPFVGGDGGFLDTRTRSTQHFRLRISLLSLRLDLSLSLSLRLGLRLGLGLGLGLGLDWSLGLGLRLHR